MSKIQIWAKDHGIWQRIGGSLVQILAGTVDTSRAKIFDPGQVNYLLLRSSQPSLVWVWKISPENFQIFKFFPFESKKIFSSQVKKYLGQRRVGLLFTAVESMVGSSQGRPSL